MYYLYVHVIINIFTIILSNTHYAQFATRD